MPKVQSATFVQEPPVIEINGGVAIIRYRDSEAGEHAMSVKNLARVVERGQRALRRHAAGEENIIVDD